MAYYKNPITRFILRKNVVGRIKMRLSGYKRLYTKDAISDIAFLEEDREVKTIFDVGANVGFVTFQFQKRFPNADIFAFEPNPYVFNQLKENYKNDSKIHVYQMGVGDHSGYEDFNINANSGTSSFLEADDYHQAHQAKYLREIKSTQIIRIDDFCQQEGIRHIDILKMDIEGYELHALRGAIELISKQAIDIIYTEVNFVPSYKGQPLFHEVTGFLKGHNYHIYNIDSFIGQETAIRQAIVGNATYISGTFRELLENKFGKANCGW